MKLGPNLSFFFLVMSLIAFLCWLGSAARYAGLLIRCGLLSAVRVCKIRGLCQALCVVGCKIHTLAAAAVSLEFRVGCE